MVFWAICVVKAHTGVRKKRSAPKGFSAGVATQANPHYRGCPNAQKQTTSQRACPKSTG